jgi:hypothetical protein
MQCCTVDHSRRLSSRASKNVTSPLSLGAAKRRVIDQDGVLTASSCAKEWRAPAATSSTRITNSEAIATSKPARVSPAAVYARRSCSAVPSSMKFSTVRPGPQSCRVISSTNRAVKGAGEGLGQNHKIRPLLSNGIQGVVGLGEGKAIGVPPGDSGINGMNVELGVSAAVWLEVGVPVFVAVAVGELVGVWL